MLLPFNVYTIHELIALVIASSVAASVGAVYLISRRRQKSQGVFAIYQLVAAGGMALFFLQDNVVPQGRSAWGWPGGPGADVLARRTLWLSRMIWQAGLLGTLFRLHFAVLYTGREVRLRPHVRVAYAVVIAVILSVALLPMLRMPDVPASATGGWHCRVPWMPRPGSLMWGYLAIWLVAHIWTLALLGRKAMRRSRHAPAVLPGAGVIFVAFLADFLLVTVEIVMNIAGWHTPALTPVGVTISGLIVGITLLRQYQSLRRLEVEYQAAQEELSSAREQERKGLGREVYSSLRRSLSQLHLSLAGGLGQKADSQRERGQRLAEAIEQSRELTGKIRRICYGLYPPRLEKEGLAAAMDQLVQQWRREGVEVTLSFGPDVLHRRFSTALEFFLYRFCGQLLQEALASGRAGPLEMRLQCSEDCLGLEVFDGDPHSTLAEALERLGDFSRQIRQVGGRLESFGREGGQVLHLEWTELQQGGLPTPYQATTAPTEHDV
jgi:hypothetical protein